MNTETILEVPQTVEIDPPISSQTEKLVAADSIALDGEITEFVDDSLLAECGKTLAITNTDADYGLIEEMYDYYSAEDFLDKKIYQPFEHLPGRPALYSVAGLVEFVESILSACSMAQEKRRSNEIKTVGISMPDLRNHILANFAEVREKFPRLGVSSVRRLGMAPHKGRIAAKYYHCTISMKKFRVENNKFLFTDHSHSAFAQINLIFEQCVRAQGLGDRVAIFSSDVTQSLLVGGTTLTSRYHHNRKILTNEFPGTPSHDFVTIGKIRPYGYLELSHSHSSDDSYEDVLGRSHILVPHNGLLNVFLRKEHPTIEFYLNDIAYLLRKKLENSRPSFVVNSSDRGSGWDLQSESTFVFFGRYWKDSKLTGLVQMSPAENMSAFNKIERHFSSFHDHLGGVVANDKIDGVIPKDSDGKNKLLDDAMKLVCELESEFKINCQKVCFDVSFTPFFFFFFFFSFLFLFFFVFFFFSCLFFLFFFCFFLFFFSFFSSFFLYFLFVCFFLFVCLFFFFLFLFSFFLLFSHLGSWRIAVQ
jgi:hypothetical protein